MEKVSCLVLLGESGLFVSTVEGHMHGSQTWERVERMTEECYIPDLGTRVVVKG